MRGSRVCAGVGFRVLERRIVEGCPGWRELRAICEYHKWVLQLQPFAVRGTTSSSSPSFHRPDCDIRLCTFCPFVATSLHLPHSFVHARYITLALLSIGPAISSNPSLSRRNKKLEAPGLCRSNSSAGRNDSECVTSREILDANALHEDYIKTKHSCS